MANSARSSATWLRTIFRHNPGRSVLARRPSARCERPTQNGVESSRRSIRFARRSHISVLPNVDLELSGTREAIQLVGELAVGGVKAEVFFHLSAGQLALF